LELRTNFLKGFVGDKLQEALPKCPIECMFWDWIYSYYPDNDISPIRFAGFTRKFVNFLIENKKFALDYGNWIKLNTEKMVNAATKLAKNKITSFDIRMYADMMLQSIKESQSCVLFLFFEIIGAH